VIEETLESRGKTRAEASTLEKQVIALATRPRKESPHRPGPAAPDGALEREESFCRDQLRQGNARTRKDRSETQCGDGVDGIRYRAPDRAPVRDAGQHAHDDG